MEEINAYKCDYCGKIYASSKTCKGHEKNCYYNPMTRSCASCRHLIMEKKYISSGEYSGYQGCRAGGFVQEKGLRSGCKLYSEREELL